MSGADLQRPNVERGGGGVAEGGAEEVDLSVLLIHKHLTLPGAVWSSSRGVKV